MRKPAAKEQSQYPIPDRLIFERESGFKSKRDQMYGGQLQWSEGGDSEATRGKVRVFRDLGWRAVRGF